MELSLGDRQLTLKWVIARGANTLTSFLVVSKRDANLFTRLNKLPCHLYKI